MSDEYESRRPEGADTEELVSEIGSSIRTYKNQQASRAMRDGSPDREAMQESLDTIREDIREYADRVLDDDDWQQLRDEIGDQEYSAEDLAGEITHSIKQNEYEKAGKQVRTLDRLAGQDDLSEGVSRYLK